MAQEVPEPRAPGHRGGGRPEEPNEAGLRKVAPSWSCGTSTAILCPRRAAPPAPRAGLPAPRAGLPAPRQRSSLSAAQRAMAARTSPAYTCRSHGDVPRGARRVGSADEMGTLHKQADLTFALVYPSPYHVGMSSLGLPDHLPRAARARPASAAERAFLPDDVAAPRASAASRWHLRIGAPGRRLPGGRVLARLRARAGRPGRLPRARRHPRARQRARRARPSAIRSSWSGGPLTFSNPLPAGPFADVILHRRGRGAGRHAAPTRSATQPDRARAARATSRRCPASTSRRIHGEHLPPIAAAADDTLPGALADPHAAHRAVATCS